MVDVADTRHLERRGDIWHYRRRVPAQYAGAVGKAVLRHSLGTASLKQARILRDQLNVEYHRLFAEIVARSEGRTVEGRPHRQPSVSVLIERVRAHVTAQDQRAATSHLRDPPESLEQRQEMLGEALNGLSVLQDPENPNADEAAQALATRLLEPGEQLPQDLSEAIEVFEVVRGGLIELERRRIARLDGDYSGPVHDELFRPDAPRLVTFHDLANIYWAEKEEDYRTNRRSAKRIDKVRAVLGFLLEVIGADTPVAEIDDDTVQTLRRILSRMPANRRRLYPDLTLAEAVEQGERDGARALSPVTQRIYLDVLRDVLQVGVRKQYIRANFAEGLTPIRKESIAPSERRLPWTNAQLVGFFTGKFYQACAPGAPAPYSKSDRGWRFWLPLLMLFLGLRPNEITQLHVDDLKRTAQGTWYLDLTDAGDEEGGMKTLKTASSRRRVPLDPELIKIGFLAFVEERTQSCADGERRLFPELTADKYGNTAKYATRRMREDFIPAEIKLNKRQTLYSLRHNVRDALRRVEAPADTLLAVTGWSPAGKAVESSYGDPGNPDLHAKWVAKISYPGLDLSFLHVVQDTQG